jgi:uncharacterized protein YndB with AHSA1/START domain
MGYGDVQPNVAGSENIMEYGSIERDIYVDATPDVVFEVVSQPEHIREWWSDEADFESTPGGAGELVWGDREHVAPITIVDVDRPRSFSFRWCYPEGQTLENSLLVTFELIPSGEGTLLRMTETGFREMGWEVAVLEQQYAEHIEGWDRFIPILGVYATKVVAGR